MASAFAVRDHRPREIQGVEHGVARCLLSVDDLSEGATSETIAWSTLVTNHPTNASNLPANARIMYAWANLLETFGGGDVTACTVSLGDAGAATEQLNAINVFTGQQLGLKPKNGAYTEGTLEPAYSPQIVIATTDDNVDKLETGLIEICIAYEAISTDAIVLE